MIYRKQLIFLTLFILIGVIFWSWSYFNQPFPKKNIYNKKYKCDSIAMLSNNYIMDDDSTIYNIPKKVAFDFKFMIDSSIILIDKKEYHYLIAGLNPDTVGLISKNENYYTFRNDKQSEDNILFDFNRQVADTWIIPDEGYFNDYNIKLTDIYYNKDLNDSIYCFQFDLERVFPHGYSFTEFRVSKKYGVINYSLEVDGDLGLDTVNCNCD